MERFSKYLYCPCITKHVAPQLAQSKNRVLRHRFQRTLANCGLKFKSTTYTSTMDENLIWEDFANFLKLIQNCWQTKQHDLKHILI